MRTGLTVTCDLGVAGQLNWGGDNSANGAVRIGRLQICWRTGTVSTGAYAGEYYAHVNFPQGFNRNPSITVSLNDPGYGVSTLQGGVGVWNLTARGFDVVYKYNLNRAHTDTFYWLAVGSWT